MITLNKKKGDIVTALIQPKPVLSKTVIRLQVRVYYARQTNDIQNEMEMKIIGWLQRYKQERYGTGRGLSARE